MKKLFILALVILFCSQCVSTIKIVYEGTITYVEHIKGFTRLTFDSGAICLLAEDMDHGIEIGKRYWLVIKGRVVDYKEVMDTKEGK